MMEGDATGVQPCFAISSQSCFDPTVMLLGDRYFVGKERLLIVLVDAEKDVFVTSLNVNN